MREFSGLVLNPGFAYGKVFVLKHTLELFEHEHHLEDQVQILKDAIAIASSRLQEQIQSASVMFNERISVIFEAHKLMISDPMILGKTYQLIKEGQTAYAAYQKAAEDAILLFKQLDSEYMKNRAIDIEDATNRVLYAIQSKSYEVSLRFDTPRILIIEEMKPSILFNCDKECVLGYISAKGSYNQHSAVIARTKDIPSMVISDILNADIQEDDLVFMNGYTGKAYLNPSIDFVNEQLEKR